MLGIIEEIRADKLKELHYCVYTYIECETKKVRYIGIVNNGKLANRHKNHTKEDWYKTVDFEIEYLKCENQSETEAIESHLISLYPEEQLLNKAKKWWGRNKYLPCNFEWTRVEVSVLDIIQRMKIHLIYSKGISECERTILWEYVNALEREATLEC